MVARVTLDVAVRREFDYLVPEELVPSVHEGTRVKVPFGPREVMGVVTAVLDDSPHGNLREIIKTVGGQALVTPPILRLVRWIAEAGGVAVLAHPRKYQLTATKLRELTADFRRAGGQAIEVSTSGQSSGDLGFLAELCRKEKLLASQGSDFHFPGAPWCELGRIMKMPDGLEPVWHSFRQPVPGAAPV